MSLTNMLRRLHLWLIASVISTTVSVPNPLPPNLWHVASVNGKSYYANSKTYMSWFEALAYCDSLGMQLATIRSPAQLFVLMNAYDQVHYNGYFWIAARDSAESRQFSWNDNSLVDSASFSLPIDYGVKYQTCLYLFRDMYLNNIVAHKCTNLLGTLCETL